MSKICPKCQSQTSDYKDKSQVTLNYCGSCKGIWFDGGELADYGVDVTLLIKSGPADGHKNSYVCPCCPGNHLTAMKVHPKDDLVIDLCNSCQGVFLDAAELGKLRSLNRHYGDASKILKSALGNFDKRGLKKLG